MTALTVDEPSIVLRWAMSSREVRSSLEHKPGRKVKVEEGRIVFDATVFGGLLGEIQSYFDKEDKLSQIIVRLNPDVSTGFRAALDALFAQVQDVLIHQLGVPTTTRGEYPQWPTSVWRDGAVEVKHHVYDQLGTDHVVSLKKV